MTLSETLAKAEEILQEAYINASFHIYCDYEAADEQIVKLSTIIGAVEECRNALEEIE